MNPTLQEKAKRGTPLFPFQAYRMNYIGGNSFIDHHWHTEIEILHLLKGAFTLTCNTTSYSANPSDILFINAEQLHSIRPTVFPCQYDAFVFPLELLFFEMQDYVQAHVLNPLHQKRKMFPPILTRLEPYHSEIQRELFMISQNEQTAANQDPFSVKLSLLNIIRLLALSKQFQDADAHSALYEQTDRQKAILTYLSKHMNERLTLSSVSAEFGFSPKYFSRFFKKHFDKTFVQYINDLRVKKACELLLESQQSVMEISLKVGFENLGYFIRQFKRATGQTPTQYRKIRLADSHEKDRLKTM